MKLKSTAGSFGKLGSITFLSRAVITSLFVLALV